MSFSGGVFFYRHRYNSPGGDQKRGARNEDIYTYP